MTEAQKLVITYFHIVCRLDLTDTPIDFETINQWAANSQFYQYKLNDAIKCAIYNVKSQITLLESEDKLHLMKGLNDTLNELGDMQ